MYRSPKVGLMGVSKFYKKLRKQGYKVTLDTVKQAVNELEEYQVSKPVKVKRKEMLKVYANKERSYMMDLAFLNKYKASNKGYYILLTIVDMNTRQGYAFKFKKKNEITDTLESFIKKHAVQVLESDNGSEFVNKGMKNIYKKYGVDHVTFTSSTNHNTLGMIERFNRTIKSNLNNVFNSTGKNNWIDHIDDIVDNYNETPHSGLPQDKEPDEMTKEDSTMMRVEKRNHNYSIMYKDDIDVKDKVRLAKVNKDTFEKEGNTFSKQLYEVVSIDGLSYRVKNVDTGEVLKRKYKPYELQLVKNVVKIKNTRAVEGAAKELETVKKTNKVKRNLAATSKSAGFVGDKTKDKKRKPKPKKVVNL